MPASSLQSAPAPRRPSLGQLLNIPNLLTLGRICLIPVFLVMLDERRFTAALYVFALAALTDSLDGTVARWFDAKTELGAYLDPFADKLLLLSAIIVLTFDKEFPSYLLSVVIIRDVVVVFGYFMICFFVGERMQVRPSYLGKAATFLQLACVIAALTRVSTFAPREWEWLLYVTVAFTLLSGVHYTYRGLAWLSSRQPQMFE